MIISVVVVPAVLLLLFTVISFCGRVRLQHSFSESFHNVRLDFWLSPWKKMPFFFFVGGERVSPFLHLSYSLHFWGFIIFLGKWELLNACDRCLWFFFFFKKFLSCKNKRKRKKLVLFEGKWGPKLLNVLLAKSQEKRPLLQHNELTLAPTMGLDFNCSTPKPACKMFNYNWIKYSK